MSDAPLPEQFAELEPYAATWCLGTEAERYQRRMASTMAQMRPFYRTDAEIHQVGEPVP